MDLPQLRDFITRNFNDSELRDLCFDLGIEYENLGGDNKSAKARELVAYCQRHGRLTELETTCRRLRPNAAPGAGRETDAPTSNATPNASTVNRSGGLDIHATTVNIYGDVAGRDKATSSDSESDQSPPSS
jgi:hypothetical protein